MEWKTRFKLIFLLAIMTNPLGNAYASVEDFHGFTFGFGVGTTALTADIDRFSGTLPGINSKNKSTKFNPLGILSIGYGSSFGHYFIGPQIGLNFLGTSEVNVSNSTVLTSSTVGGGVTIVDTDSIFSETKIDRHVVEPFLDLRAGFALSRNALAYFKGGVSYNTLTVKNATGINSTVLRLDTETGELIESVQASSRLRFTDTDHRVGIRAGIGGEFMFTPYLSLATDYVYTFHRTLHQDTSGSFNNANCIIEGCVVESSSFSSANNTKIHDQKVMAQLIYYMDE